ncbi:MAG: aminoacyl-tRNA hydrolase [Bacteroidaceae bacterium]|nr:aminoacyl-tRNA hydrolase [Bacteroidaceae bacterium]
MKNLIVGLGNIGIEYEGTRHNIGFRILDALAKASASNVVFEDKRYGFVAHMRVKNQELVLLKPSTYMNLSGNAVRYWMQQEKVPLERVLIVCDDISLPLGSIRMRQGGANGGHNGLKHIAQVLGTQQFNRLRFGVGGDFPKGGQVDFVLGHFLPDEEALVDERKMQAAEAIKAYALSGMTFAMNHFNGK